MSLIGARSAMVGGGGKGWTNPYVTDGLVAMWDGQWNAGVGVHDAAAETWKDLVGGRDFSIVNPNWGDDYISFYNSTCYGMLSESDSSIFNLQEATLTIVVGDDNSWKSRGIFLKTSSSSNIGLAFFNGNVGFTNSYSYAYPFPSVSRESITGVYSAGEISQVLYGTTIKTNSTYNSIGQSQNYVSIGKRMVGTTYYADGKMFNIRLYSRALTAAEIAANYAVDKVRFNLP